MSSIQTLNVARSIKWVGLVKLISQLATFGTTIAISRFLTKEEFGLSAMAFVVMGLIDSLIDFGFAAAIIQRKEVSNRELSSCFWLLAICGAAAAITLYLFSPLLGLGFNDSRINSLLEIMAITLLIVPFQIIYRGILNRNYQLVSLAKLDLMGLIIRSVTSIALAIAGAGVWSIVIGFMAEKIIIAAAMPFATKWLPEMHMNKHELAPFVNFGAKITVSKIIFFFLSRVDVIIIGRILGAQTLGVYSLALQFSNVVLQLITSTGISVAYPLFARLRESEQFLNQIRISEEMVTFFSLPAIGGLFLIAPDIINVSLGNQWMEASVYLRYLCIATLFQIMGFLFPQAINAVNKPMVNVYINGFLLLTYIAGLFVAATLWGIKGCLIALIFLSVMRFLVTLTAAKIILGIKIKEIFFDLAKHGLITVAMMITAQTFADIFFIQMGSFSRIVSIIGIGAVSYGLLQLLLSRKLVLTLLHSLAKK